MSYDCMRYRSQLTPREERMIAKAIVHAVKADPDGWSFDPPRASYRDRFIVNCWSDGDLDVVYPHTTDRFRKRIARKVVRALHRLRHSQAQARRNPQIQAIVAALETPKPEPIDITPTVQVAEPKRVPLAA